MAAAVPVVRDDAFFLGKWGRCNGAAPVRENCQVIRHGRIAGVQRLAAGCTVIGIPGRGAQERRHEALAAAQTTG
ncbi:MAG: hypothetical protein GYB50_00770 [Rhodobacteraceae bacterium]|nr:hypothetical protein [Paracoccaceae bacterium]